MADSWFALWFFGRAPLEEAIPTAKNAAARALELDPTLGEAHGVLGAASLYADWSWRRAAPSLRRAVELSPNEATVRHYYADYLLVTDDVEGSLREVQIGAQLDPVSPLATLAGAVSSGGGEALSYPRCSAPQVASARRLSRTRC